MQTLPLPSLTTSFLSFVLVLVELQQLGPHSFSSQVISFSFGLVPKIVVPEMVVSVAEKIVSDLVVLDSHSFSS